MQQSNNKFDPLGIIITLITFSFMTLHIFVPGMSYNSPNENIYNIIQLLLVGSYFLYFGLKSLRRQQGITRKWYTLPFILMALGTFLILPSLLLASFDTSYRDSDNVALSILLATPSAICIFASFYFGIMRLFRDNKTQTSTEKN